MIGTRSREEILVEVQKTLKELFDIDPSRVTLETRVVEDLDLDSIDAIDLAVRIEELTGSRLPEDALRSIRTVSDVVALLESELATGAAGTTNESTGT